LTDLRKTNDKTGVAYYLSTLTGMEVLWGTGMEVLWGTEMQITAALTLKIA
jgi:hypothetical protein